MAVYSFLDTQASIAGPGGFAQLAAGAAAAEEGITIEAAEDKNVMTIGADGQGQHSLIASNAATITVRLLKTSPQNAILQLMYNLQSASSSVWGQNIITISNTHLGDITLTRQAAFKKKPSLTYAKEGGMNEWVFDAIVANTVLGSSA